MNGIAWKQLAMLVATLGSATALSCSAETTDSPSGSGATGATTAAGGSGGTAPGSAGTPAGGTGVGTAGTPGTTAGSGGTGTSTAGAGNGGSAGTGPAMPLCTTKTTVASPLIADFETYDGVVAPPDYQWVFGGAAAGELGAHAGTYAFGDGSVEPALAFLAGHGGNYGLTVSVTGASKWGLGFGMFLLDKDFKPACLNASAYKGISMWVRGSVPTNTLSLSVVMAQGVPTAMGGSCAGADDTTCKPPTISTLPVTATWTQIDVLWADLTGGLSGAATPLVANGDNITGLSFGANLVFMPESEGSMTYVPVPGDISVAIDDVSFIP